MEHYVCTGECKGVSDKPMSCQMKTCSKHGKPLELCTCEDSKHADVLRKNLEK